MAEPRSQGHTGGSGPQPMRPKVVPFGKYLLLERISVGGMAEVYKAKAFGVEGFEKILAIKRILPTIAEDEEFIDMFIDEAKIVGQLSHANICQVLELGRIGDSHFIAMEYIWGRDLLQIQNHFRRQKQVMPVPMAVFVMSKVCEGLDYAHRKRDPQGRPLNIVHRDVSPQNILAAYEGAVKIIDFGIARAAYRQTRTQAGVLKGKFGYMSPEQVRGLPIDRRSDLFAVGTLLYELLTGERLFLGESDFSTLDKVRNAEVDPPTKYNRNIPPDLERIILKALTRDPDDRWQWASEFQEALQRVLINFKPVFTTQKLSAWMKQTFSNQIARDKVKMEDYARLGSDALVQARRQKPPPTPPDAKATKPPTAHPSGAPPQSPVSGVAQAKAAASSASPRPMNQIGSTTGDQVSLDAAEMDWLMSGSDDDDDELPGESTVIADMDFMGSGESPAQPGTEEVPDDFDDDYDEEEATSIYFVNEDALKQADALGSDNKASSGAVAEQATRLLDTNDPNEELSVNTQSTVIFDENKSREALAANGIVSISPSVMIQGDNGGQVGQPQKPPRSEVPVPAAGLPSFGEVSLKPAEPEASQSSNLPPLGAPKQQQNAGPPPADPGRSQLPKTMLKAPGGAPPLALFPGEQPQPTGAAPEGSGHELSSGPYQAASMPPGHPPTAQPANRGGPFPMEPSPQTELVRGQRSPAKEKKRSPLLMILLAALGVILLGAIAGVIVLVVYPMIAADSGSGVTPSAASTTDVGGGEPAGENTPASPNGEQPSAGQATDPGSPGEPPVVPPPEIQQARLVLTILPTTSTVEVDGAPVALAAAAEGVSLAPGQDHTIRVSAPGHVAQELTLNPQPGQEDRREIMLSVSGRLALTTTPPAVEVSLDGERAGTTPLTLENIDYGQHSLRFALKGYEPVSRTVNVNKEAPQQEISITLEKVRVAQIDTPRTNPPQGNRNINKNKNRPENNRPAANTEGQGFLVVSTQPWGHVYVDGRDTGRDTPILPSNPLRLSSGRHRLTIQINSGQRFTFPITIVAGETRRFMRRLSP